MDFQKLKSELPNDQPETFLKKMMDTKNEHDHFITFSYSINEQFIQNCQFLASNETISESDIAQWQENEFLVVAQTIDGDYIAGTLQETFIIPVSLYKTDMEIVALPLADFFIAYTAGFVQSKILPSL